VRKVDLRLEACTVVMSFVDESPDLLNGRDIQVVDLYGLKGYVQTLMIEQVVEAKLKDLIILIVILR
jgi:hypothetical protein